MVQKFIFSLGLLFFGVQVQAADYDCSGPDASNAGEIVSIEIGVSETNIKIAQKSVRLAVNLPRKLRPNEDTLKFAAYLLGNYDGAGGYVKVSVPKNVAVAVQAVSGTFVAYYDRDTYSGEIQTDQVRAQLNCKAK
jgi:hypothetical protein